MAIQRWGAFSIVDHMDARKLAADVLLYDRLVLPIPEFVYARLVAPVPNFAYERLPTEHLESLERRIKQLGVDSGDHHIAGSDADKAVVIPARWTPKLQEFWEKKLEDLKADTRYMNAGLLNMTRQVLAENFRDYRPPGVGAVEVVAAYQCEADFAKLDPHGSENAAANKAALDFLIASRIAVPDDEDPERSLERSLELRQNSKFIERRKRFHDWERKMIAGGVSPADASEELVQLVADYNNAVRASKGSFRVETAMLVGTLSLAAIAAIAPLLPALVAGLGIGVLTGVQVVSIGHAANGAVLQIVRHVRGRKEPDANHSDFSGAMFHQIEDQLGWRLRAGPDMKFPTSTHLTM